MADASPGRDLQEAEVEPKQPHLLRRARLEPGARVVQQRLAQLQLPLAGSGRPPETCPISTGGGTRRVRLVREEGRDVSSQYGREGEGGGGRPPVQLAQRLPPVGVQRPRDALCDPRAVLEQELRPISTG